MKKTIAVRLALLLGMMCGAQNAAPLRYADGNQALEGWLAGAGTQRPGVLILPAWMGIDNEARTAAQQLAQQGYVVLVADIYGVGQNPTNRQEAGQKAGYYKTHYEAYQSRIRKGLEALIQQGADPNRIAVIGFCFGGTGALEAARAALPVRGVVSIHGGLSKEASRPNTPISCKVLIEHPLADATVAPEQIKALVAELVDGKADFQWQSYPGCGHTFTNPESAEYKADLALKAWSHTLAFLKEVLE